MTDEGVFRLSEEQVLLRDTVHALAMERIAPRAAEIDRTAEFPWDVRDVLAEHDLFALGFPAEHGGLDAGLLTLCIAVEQISRACASSGLMLAVQSLGALPLILAGTPDQQARWLPGMAAGRDLVAFALTEPDAGSDASAIRTRAERDEVSGDWVISGTKRFISHGSVAAYVAVLAVTNPDGPRHRRLSCLLVPTTSPGFSVLRLEHKMGIRGSPTAELAFDRVRVPADHLIGADGDGFDIAMRTFERSRPGIAAQAVGIAQGALDEIGRAHV